MNWKGRTQLLLGVDALNRLADSHVLIVGVGGVGAYAAEMLCRSGVGKITIVDGDIVNESNKNRQLIALDSTMGQSKADVLSKRLLDINPELKIKALNQFIKEEETRMLLESDKYDYIVDAIDTLSPKVYLIKAAIDRNIPIVSSMGSGGKDDPSSIKIADISKSHNCTLAKVVRKRLYRLGIRKGIPVVFSTQLTNKEAVFESDTEQNKKSTVGTISYMPAIFGCNLGAYVIKQLTKNTKEESTVG